MKTRFLIIFFVVFLVSCQSVQKPGLRQGEFYTVEQGKAELKKMESMYSNKNEWKERKLLLKNSISEELNLSPLPSKTNLNTVIGTKRIHDGYSVENVYFESIPGYYLCGNLYRPLSDSLKHPAILCPHGHFMGDSLGMFGRFRPDQQIRCATFARMGAVVFSYSMFGWGEALKQLDPMTVIEKPDTAITELNHGIPLALTMQTWNSMRVIDFLETLPDVDKTKIGITAASGGGTQTFLLSALDDRITVSVPAVMVSSFFFGGCNCESGLPIHQSSSHFTNNAEIAAMFAPKPMMLISDGADWTKNNPTVEYPFIKRIYSFYNAENNVENAHFPDGVHDYGHAKRIPAYNFMAKHLGLNIATVTDKNGKIDESKIDIENTNMLLLFSSKNPLPSNALQGKDDIQEAFKKLRVN